MQRYNRLKAAIKREQSEACFNFVEREQARPQVKIVLAEKEWTGTWLSEQVGHNICTVSRWMTNKVQPTCGKFDLVARLTHIAGEFREVINFVKLSLVNAIQLTSIML